MHEEIGGRESLPGAAFLLTPLDGASPCYFVFKKSSSRFDYMLSLGAAKMASFRDFGGVLTRLITCGSVGQMHASYMSIMVATSNCTHKKSKVLCMF